MKFIYLIFFISFTSCSFCKERHIKTIKEYTFKDEKSGEILENRKLRTVSYLDNKERKTKEVLYDANQNIQSVFIYDHNAFGQCVAINEFNSSGDKLKESKAEFDNTGKIIPFLLSSSCDFCKQKSPLVNCTLNKEGQVIDALKYDEIYKEMIIIKLLYEYEYW